MIGVACARALRDEHRQWRANRLLARPAEHRLCRDIEQHDVLSRVHGDDSVHRRVEDAAQARLAAHQHILGARPLGDVAQDDREEFPVVLDMLRDRGFDRKFFTVGAQRHEHRQAAHAARRHACLAEALDVGAMTLAKPLRDELVQRLPEDGAAGPAESLLSRGVEHDHALSVVHGDDWVHRGFDDVADLGLESAYRPTRDLLLPGLEIEERYREQPSRRSDQARGEEELRPMAVHLPCRNHQDRRHREQRDDWREEDQQSSGHRRESRCRRSRTMLALH
jgi:hypothetical protein